VVRRGTPVLAVEAGANLRQFECLGFQPSARCTAPDARVGCDSKFRSPGRVALPELDHFRFQKFGVFLKFLLVGPYRVRVVSRS
jgi:hypothetical protein